VATQCPKCHSENPETKQFCADCGTHLIPSQSPQFSKTLTMETPAEGLTRGTIFAGRYEILEELGTGGMGSVYRVFDRKLEEEVALKLIRPDIAASRKTIERFKNEIKVARKITHPNVCRVHDLHEEGKTLYITMEYVRGEDLKSVIHRMGTLTTGKAVSIAQQAADGLAEAHKLGIIHRDLKPGNIMIDREGSAKIMDFGIARSLEDKGSADAGMIIGTPEYMSPEQAEGKEADQRSDIYALGVIIYEMITGKAPFEGATASGILKKHRTEAPPDPKGLNPQVTPGLARMILKCLEKDGEKRYQDAGEVLAELDDLATSMTKKAAEKKWKNSIAVLPFADLSPQRDQEYFCDGLAEELINSLSHIHELKVAARTSAFAFKGKDLDIREIGKALSVQAILEGSVRKAGERLRITAQLVNVADGYHLWSEKYDRGMEDIFAIQDEISLDIADKLKLRLVKGEKTKVLKRHTRDKDAYNLFLKGRYFWNRRNEGDLKKAIEFYDEAIKTDPNYSLPYLGIADHFIMMGLWNYLPPQTARLRAKEALDKALEIDDQLGEAYTSLGYYQCLFDWDWPAAEKNLRRGIALNPHNSMAHAWYGCYLFGMSRFKDALAELKMALEIEPLSPIINALAGFVISLTDPDGGKKQVDKAIEMEPNLALAHLWMGMIYMYPEVVDEKAVEHLQIAVDLGLIFALGWLGCAYSRLGNREEAFKILSQLDELSKERYISPLQKSLVYSGLGMYNQAFEFLEKALSQKEPVLAIYLYTVEAHSAFSQEFRLDERFQALMRKGEENRT
jgi:eukaryotic-like serine/threonine-protein kinase